MYSNRREVALAKKLVKLGGTQGALDEDDDLVELQIIQKLVELPVLLLLLESNKVLLQTVQRQLGVLVDVVLCRVLHELLANRLDLIRESGREHHNLLLLGRSTEDLLHVTAHVYSTVSTAEEAGNVLNWNQSKADSTYQSDRASCHTHRGQRFARC